MNYYDMNPLAHGVNFSFLKMGLQKSWKHAYEAYVLGLQSAPTPAMQKGTLIHCLALEPLSFNDRYIVAPEINRRTKAGKQQWQELIASAGNRVVISEDDYLEAVDCQMKLSEHPWFSKVMHREDTTTEDELYGTMGDTKVRGKVDILTSDFIVDLKTTSDASPVGFQRSVRRFMYDAQLAFYADLAGVEEAYIIAIETNGTHQIAVYQLSKETLEHGRRQYQEALDLFGTCLSLYPTLGSPAFTSYQLEPFVI